jgi:hypothetical protein
MEEPTLEESIAELLKTAPPPIRSFVLNNLSAKTSELMQKYKLHIDQGGLLETELLLMLVGQSQPQEFVAALQEGGISEEVVTPLLNDINEQVFAVLRKTEETSSAPVPMPPPVLTQPKKILLSIPAPPIVVPSLSATSPLPAPVVPTAVSVPVVPPISKPSSVSNITASPGHPTMRTMATDMQAAKEHRVPEPFFSRPAPVAPLPVPAPVAPPVVMPPPIMPLPSTSSIVPPPLPPHPHAAEAIVPASPHAAPPPPNLPGTPPAPPYGIDPYHEPVE